MLYCHNPQGLTTQLKKKDKKILCPKQLLVPPGNFVSIWM